MNDWVKKLWYINTVGYYAALIKNLIFQLGWSLKDFLSEVSNKQWIDTYYL